MRVLLIDDEPALTASLGRRLRQVGWQIAECPDGPSAIELLEAESVDAVVCDHQMPGMTGLEVCEKIAHFWPRVIRVMLTGQASLDLAIQAINRGHVDRFFVKPCAGEELICAIMRERKYRLALTAVQALLDQHHGRATTQTVDLYHVPRDATGAILLDDLPTDADSLLRRFERTD